MIAKNTLQSVISKYYLGGLFDRVKWVVRDNKLLIGASGPGRACKITLNNFEFENCELGINDTHKLSKLIAVTNGDLMLNVEKSHKIFTKLNIADSNFDVNYSLADIFIIPPLDYFPEIEDTSISINLESENVDALIKGKNALLDENKMLISSVKDLDGNLICEFTFGDIEQFANKVTYSLQADICCDGIAVPFNSDIFKEILNNNKDMETGTLKLNKEENLIQFNFTSGDIESEYFLVRNE